MRQPSLTRSLKLPDRCNSLLLLDLWAARPLHLSRAKKYGVFETAKALVLSRKRLKPETVVTY
jgi:hypothetical protein